jgi:hypothetical protein
MPQSSVCNQQWVIPLQAILKRWRPVRYHGALMGGT